MTTIYRVDKFIVPDEVRQEFWANVRMTHAVLRRQPGFVDDVLLDKRSGASSYNAVTIVQWSSSADLTTARAAVHHAHHAAGFDPAAYFDRASIVADLANYVPLGG